MSYIKQTAKTIHEEGKPHRSFPKAFTGVGGIIGPALNAWKRQNQKERVERDAAKTFAAGYPDDAERFEARVQRDNVDVRRFQKKTFIDALLYLAVIGGVLWSANVLYNWSMGPLGSVPFVAVSLALFVAAIREAFLNFQLRERRLVGVREWLKRPAEWFPEL